MRDPRLKVYMCMFDLQQARGSRPRCEEDGQEADTVDGKVDGAVLQHGVHAACPQHITR
jgi:hypothetical protein